MLVCLTDDAQTALGISLQVFLCCLSFECCKTVGFFKGNRRGEARCFKK